MNSDHRPKLCHPDLLKPAEHHCPWIGCCIITVVVCSASHFFSVICRLQSDSVTIIMIIFETPGLHLGLK